MVFIIPWQDPVAIDGSAYNQLGCYKSLFPPPEPSHSTFATKTGMSSIYEYTHLADCSYSNTLRPFMVDLLIANASLHTCNSLNKVAAHHQATGCASDLPMLRTPD
jgi:hypothetical protein